jgi:hypothetical protein
MASTFYAPIYTLRLFSEFPKDTNRFLGEVQTFLGATITSLESEYETPYRILYGCVGSDFPYIELKYYGFSIVFLIYCFENRGVFFRFSLVGSSIDHVNLVGASIDRINNETLFSDYYTLGIEPHLFSNLVKSEHKL